VSTTPPARDAGIDLVVSSPRDKQLLLVEVKKLSLVGQHPEGTIPFHRGNRVHSSKTLDKRPEHFYFRQETVGSSFIDLKVQ